MLMSVNHVDEGLRTFTHVFHSYHMLQSPLKNSFRIIQWRQHTADSVPVKLIQNFTDQLFDLMQVLVYNRLHTISIHEYTWQNSLKCVFSNALKVQYVVKLHIQQQN